MKIFFQYIFNPFSKIGDKPLMLIGILSAVFGAMMSYLYKTVFDGIVDVHSYPFITYSQAITANIINIVLPCILLFVLGRKINPQTKMIDILNASFIYRIPFYIMPFLINLPVMKGIEDRINQIENIKNLQFDTNEWVLMLLISFVTLIVIAYAITLLVNGFRNATGAKTSQHYLGFAAVFIVCEILSKLIITMLL